ncbi:PEP-CTERM sorting domain-containing protein [Massilia sp. S19_KUP03_FR1]|uniref:PEP-CTERM sorting domain-containing protein n=1 Tax=Massilia sp. S19_KUP03_FR1 TaxID=3025503 RepID=UPI002FCD27F3
MTRLHTLLAATFFLAGSQVCAAAITVLPSDLNVGGLNQWNLSNLRGTSNGYTSTTTAGITTANPRNGNGSVQMSLTNSSGKADYAYTWGYDGARTLGTLTSLSYDWYRSSASSAGGVMPALRLLYDADGSAATTADQGYLIYEQIYNPNVASVVSDQWASSDLLTANLWQRKFSPGETVESYGVTLADWTSGNNQPANADRLNASSAILGIEFGIGSGWNGSFNGFVDNVSFGFSQNVTTFNFEAAAAAVPEPGSIALLGLGVFGLAAVRRRKAK